MKIKKTIFVSSAYLIGDPPTFNAVNSFLSAGYHVIYCQQSKVLESDLFIQGVRYLEIPRFSRLFNVKFTRLFNYMTFVFFVNYYIFKYKPDVVVSIMFAPISAIFIRKSIKCVAAILDVPAPISLGSMDALIFKNAISKLTKYNTIWFSDELKRKLICENRLAINDLLVCHNTPALDYFKDADKIQSREWLINRLRANHIEARYDSLVLIRAGAFGENGGLEETLTVLKELPSQFIFVLMGRPESLFLDKFRTIVSLLNLESRVYICDNPSNLEWRHFLLGSDIGHLIHLRPANNVSNAAMFDLNSSLSNNRLFQYMAAALPIVSYDDKRLEKLHKEVNCFVVVDSENIVNSLKNNLLKLMNNVEFRSFLATNARNSFLNKYNWDMEFNVVLSSIEN